MTKVQNCAVRHAPTRGRLARCSLRRRSLYPRQGGMGDNSVRSHSGSPKATLKPACPPCCICCFALHPIAGFTLTYV
jgi:hypothetical protein